MLFPDVAVIVTHFSLFVFQMGFEFFPHVLLQLEWQQLLWRHPSFFFSPRLVGLHNTSQMYRYREIKLWNMPIAKDRENHNKWLVQMCYNSLMGA